jgi:hypothetical protein
MMLRAKATVVQDVVKADPDDVEEHARGQATSDFQEAVRAKAVIVEETGPLVSDCLLIFWKTSSW